MTDSNQSILDTTNEWVRAPPDCPQFVTTFSIDSEFSLQLMFPNVLLSCLVQAVASMMQIRATPTVRNRMEHSFDLVPYKR